MEDYFYWSRWSAGNCSHAVNDFRKLCNLESYTPVDNVSELKLELMTRDGKIHLVIGC